MASKKLSPARTGVSLRSDKRGRWQLFHAERPIPEVNRFLAAVATRGLSRATVRAYGFDLVVLYRWLERSGQSLRVLSGELLLEYVAAQQRLGAQPSSINRRLTTTRLLYRFCTGRELEQGRGAISPAPHYRGR